MTSTPPKPRSRPSSAYNQEVPLVAAKDTAGGKAKGISLSFVVGGITAFVVLVVASVTFAITYTTSLASVEDVGIKYAKSLVATARVRTEDLFNAPTQAMLGMRAAGRFDGMIFPSREVGTDFATTSRIRDMMLSTVLQLGTRMPLYSVVFLDGSQVVFRFFNATILVVHMSNARTIRNPGDTCCAITETEDYHWPSLTPTATPVSNRTASRGDGRFPVVEGAIIVAYLSEPGLWTTPVYYEDGGNEGYFLIPAAVTFRNATDPIGVILGSVSIDEAAAFLQSLKLTANSHMFLLDAAANSVAATTHPAPFITRTPTTNRY